MFSIARIGLFLGVSLLALGCGERPPATAYLEVSTQGTAREHARDMDVEDLKQGEDSLKLGNTRLEPDSCGSISLKPEYDPLTPGNLAKFLRDQGYQIKIERARHDLHYFDVSMPGNETMRLRVATLNSAPEAARDLHRALLEHGRGSWGVHRSNVAVLAPIGNNKEIIELAVETKLACWGVLTIAGRDDTFVVPGGYIEL